MMMNSLQVSVHKAFMAALCWIRSMTSGIPF